MQNHKIGYSLLSLFVGLITINTGIAAERERDLHVIELSAAPLAEALQSLSRQTGSNILVPQQQVQGLHAEAVTGELTVEQALQRLLQGSGLVAESQEGDSFIIRPGSGERARSVPLLQESSLTAPRLQNVVVIGTRRENALALESTSPVDVISSEQLLQSGYGNVAQALQAVSPSFHFPLNLQGDGTAAVRSASLRGLSSDETLVLVNGKRRHASAAVVARSTAGRGSQVVDINTIPVSAIERIEVLRDGAAAQYGSDAIAGVINIVLRNAEQGGEIQGQVGEFSKGDGFSRSLSAWKGLRLGDQGRVTFSASGSKQDSTVLSNAAVSDWYFPGDPRESVVNKDPKRGAPGFEEYSLGYNGELDLRQDLTLYSFATLGKRTMDSTPGFRKPNEDNVVRGLFPDGYLPEVTGISKDFEVAGGVRYNHGQWGEFDLSASHGRNSIEYYLDNANNPTMGLDSPTHFYGGRVINWLTNTNLDYVKALDIAGLKEASIFSAGLTWRRESFGQYAGEPASYINGGVPILDGPNAGRPATPGSNGFPGYQPGDASRNFREAYGVYAGLENRLTQRWSLDLAARWENYSDFGSASTGKLSSRYEFSPQLAVRGTLSGGFKAPSLGQSYFSSSQNQTPIGLDSNRMIRVFPVAHAAARALGARDLKPEKSINYSLGTVWQPNDAWSLTADLYRIDIDDRIINSEYLTGSYVVSVLEAAGYPGVYSASYFNNAVNTRTQGLDLNARYRLALATDKQLEFSVAFNQSSTRIRKIHAAPQELQNVGLQLIGPDAINYITGKVNPKNKLILGSTYTHGRFKGNMNVIRYGQYEVSSGSGNYLDRFPVQWVVDSTLNYRVSSALTATLGAQNLFNSHPRDLRRQLGDGSQRYGVFAPAGFDGRFVFAGLSYRFD